MVSRMTMLKGCVVLTVIILLSTGIAFGQGPQVISVDPAQNALDVQQTTDVVGEFDTALDPATVDSLGIILFGNLGGRAPGTITYSDAGGQYLVTFDRSGPFLIGEQVQAVLTAQIHAGNTDHLPIDPYTWQFRVQAVGGTGTFTDKTYYYVPDVSYVLTSADFDNDNDIDLAIATKGLNMFGVSRSNGDGTFVGYQGIHTMSYPTVINTADLNNDGHVDVIVGSVSLDSIAVTLNRGYGWPTFDGSYTAVHVQNISPYEIEAADMDADGDLDLLAAGGYGSDSVIICWNDGSGSFPEPHTYYPTGGDTPVAAKAADVDNDGDLDVVAVHGFSDNVAVLINTGGTLGAPTLYPLPEAGLSLEVVDLTGDGYADMAIAPTNGSQLLVLQNIGDGTFASYETYEGNAGFSLIKTGDIDGDGDLDIVSTHQGSKYISVFTNDGGTFDGLQDYGTLQWTDFVTLADFDGDYDLDLAYASGFMDSIVVMFNADITSSLAVSDVVPDANAVDVSTSTEISVAFTTDINMSTVDNSSLIVYSPTAGKYTSTYSYDPVGRRITCSLSEPLAPGDKITVTVTEGVQATNGDRVTHGYSWSFMTETQPAPATSYRQVACSTAVLAPWQVAPSDIDRDHDVDLVTAGWGNANTAALRNDGGLSFTEQTADTTWTSLNNVCSADLNGDGYPDIVGWTEFDMDLYPYPLSILINNGDGTYTGDTIFPYISALGGVTAADLDNDGDIDLAASEYLTHSRVLAYWNDGAANFTLDTIADFGLAILGRPYAVDFNGDGQVDIAVADESATGFTVLYNNGSTFSIGGSYSMGAFGEQLLSADLNGDLYPDFITALLSGSDRVSVLLSDGSGGFLTPYGYALGGGTLPAIVTGDADGDGDVDVTVARYLGASTYGLQHLFNDGTGTLTMGDLIQSAYTTLTGLCGADFDSDGDLDMAASLLPSYPGDPDILILANSNCHDYDHDGYSDPGWPGDECAEDNCPLLSNPLQEDADVDGIADACEFSEFVPSDSPVDIGAGVEVTLYTAGNGGTVDLTVTTDGPTVPGGYNVIPSAIPTYYNLTSDIISADSVAVCIEYNDAGMTPAQEALVALYHWDGAEWIDITTSLDTLLNVVCGTTEALSPFIVAIPGATCCGLYRDGYTGNTDCSTDGMCTLSDITKLIDNVYISHAPLCCPENGDVDGSGEADATLSDITGLIDHVYISHAETAACQ